MKTCANTRYAQTRRDFLRGTAAGFGSLALTALHADWTRAADVPGAGGYKSPLAPRDPHFAPRAKRVIFLFMEGGPSHLDTFDWKPELARAAKDPARSRLLGPVFPFKPAGKSGLMMADVFPHLAGVADEMCVLNGVKTANPGHQQAIVSLHTGSTNFVRPSVGAWIVYGLGTAGENLPGFVTIDPIAAQGGAMNYGSAFLPATFQGTRLGSGGQGVPNIANTHLAAGDQRRQLDFIGAMNRRMLRHDPAAPEIEGLIESYEELAYKMQTSVPETLDLSREPEHIRRLYGLDQAATQRFGGMCLTARRLAEKGVRFIQLTSNGWDHHAQVREGVTRNAGGTDKPIAGLITDLKQRGLLKDTLILWGGEFGRGAHGDRGGGSGRGHNNKGCTMWMAGGGVKGGIRYGATDDLGERAVDGVMDIHDVHATILHLLGLDHERLTFRYAGRDFRLTDVAGKVAHGMLA